MTFPWNTQPTTERRYKILKVSPEFIIRICQQNKATVTALGMPKDARFIRAYVEDARTIAVLVESETFDTVPDGDGIPTLVVTFKQYFSDKISEALAELEAEQT